MNRETGFSPPPMPPREVSGRYARRLLMTDIRFIVGAVLGGIGLIYAVVGVREYGYGVGIVFLSTGMLILGVGVWLVLLRVLRWRRIIAVIEKGPPIRGEVLGVGPNFSVRINGRHPFKVRYSFRPLGGTVEGVFETMDERVMVLKVGMAVNVLYDPDDPAVNTLYPDWELMGELSDIRLGE